MMAGLALAGFGLLLLALVWFVSSKTSGLDRAYYTSRWQHVTKTSANGDSGARLAIIDADKLLDHALKASKFSGKNMGERLQSAQNALGSNYQNTWDAHKLRNRLVHEDVNLKKNQVTFALNTFKKSLKNLGAL